MCPCAPHRTRVFFVPLYVSVLANKERCFRKASFRNLSATTELKTFGLDRGCRGARTSVVG